MIVVNPGFPRAITPSCVVTNFHHRRVPYCREPTKSRGQILLLFRFCDLTLIGRFLKRMYSRPLSGRKSSKIHVKNLLKMDRNLFISSFSDHKSENYECNHFLNFSDFWPDFRPDAKNRGQLCFSTVVLKYTNKNKKNMSVVLLSDLSYKVLYRSLSPNNCRVRELVVHVFKGWVGDPTKSLGDWSGSNWQWYFFAWTMGIEGRHIGRIANQLNNIANSSPTSHFVLTLQEPWNGFKDPSLLSKYVRWCKLPRNSKIGKPVHDCWWLVSREIKRDREKQLRIEHLWFFVGSFQMDDDDLDWQEDEVNTFDSEIPDQ